MNTIPFNHRMAAHCETGTMSALLNHNGMSITEPMVFGVSGAFFFAYLDTSQFTFPQFVVRSKPGDIRAKIAKRLGVKFDSRKFRDPSNARQGLESLLEKGIPVAVQVDMFYMDYIPQYMRAHFNGHFITAVGKENSNYIVSDCYYPSLVQLSENSMDIARFTRGSLSPNGFQFYPAKISGTPNWDKAITEGIKQACFSMTKLPIPFLGVKGIRMLANKIPEWTTRTKDIEHLSHEIMMIHVTLEERGTGGGGFRFMYATFLQEAAKMLKKPVLSEFATRMMENGDKWREISLFVARIGKNRDLGENKLKELKDMIMARADFEERFFKDLRSTL